MISSRREVAFRPNDYDEDEVSEKTPSSEREGVILADDVIISFIIKIVSALRKYKDTCRFLPTYCCNSILLHARLFDMILNMLAKISLFKCMNTLQIFVLVKN